ncbi:MAG: copper chaperone PCu(A)C [Sulfuriferula sp.]|nr:copper chaperone PCu(A)C [Sulfuriferula sp.]
MKKAALLLSLIFAQTAFAADIKVSNAWMRATAPGQAVAGAFMDITSPVNAQLISATSPAAGKLELHTMSMDKGIMDMHEVKQIDLPKGKTISLAPGGLHVMLFDLKQAMKQGDSIPMKLDIVTANKKHQYININVSVRDLGGK